MSGFDTIVIGAGHNGLVCAWRLARAGQRVLVLEAADSPGGCARTREFAPGYRVSACAQFLGQFSRPLAQSMDLARHGLRFVAEAIPTTCLDGAGGAVTLSGDGASLVSAEDAAAYAAFRARLGRYAARLAPILQETPPRLGTSGRADLLRLARLGWQVRGLGRDAMRDLLRIVGMNVHDLVEECFASPVVRGAVAFDAVLGADAAPRSPGTVLNLLARMATERMAGATGLAQVEGGMGALGAALAGAARQAGAELRLGVRVARVLVANDRASGVALADGTEIAANRVVSSADPRRTFFELLGTAHLDTLFVRRVKHFRCRGAAGRLHLALRAAPAFRGLPEGALGHRLLIAPSPEAIELAYNPAKYGELPEHPVFEISIPTARDKGLAPAGHHVLSATVQYLPYAPRGGWETLKSGCLAGLIAALGRHAPGLPELVVAAELLTPPDLEAEFGMTGGHWHHGELAMDQFYFTRPFPGATQYSTPLAGLYLCGSGTHPGGGLTGLPGGNAAAEILRHAA